MRLAADAPDLVTSFDGTYVALGGARLVLFATATRAEVASTPLDGPADVAFVGRDRLLAVVPGAGRTQLHGFALPSLELIATLELEDRLRVVAAIGPRVLIATESLEQPRVVAVTSKILVETIGLREPLMLATAAPEERLLAASRTREAQLECWDPLLRRALFRLNLPLMPRAHLAGFSARRRLLWIAADGPRGMLEVFRFSDGRLQARVELGGTIVGAAGDPESPRLVVATRSGPEAAPLLTELDFQSSERRELAAPVAARAMCVVEGMTPMLVLVDGGAPAWMPLRHASTPEPIAPTTAPPPPRTAQAPHPRVSDPADWRNKLHGDPRVAAPATAKPAATTTPGATARPAAMARPATTAKAASRAAAAELPRAAVAIAPVDEAEPTMHWRDALCDWAEKQLLSPRRALPAPGLPEEATLATAIARLALDDGAALAVSLVYGARLVGHGEGVAAATVARVLAAAGLADDEAWAEALGRGLAGQLGLVRVHHGRLRTSAPAARFLDGAPPRVRIIAGEPSDAELPEGVVRLDGGVEPLDELGAELARRYGYDVALVRVDGAAPARTLASLLVEARLHGAWPVIDVIVKAARWTHALDDGPSVIVARGDELPALVAALPSIDRR